MILRPAQNGKELKIIRKRGRWLIWNRWNKTGKGKIKQLTILNLLHSHKQNKHKPSPIIITGIENFNELTAFINQTIGSEYFQTILMNNNASKVNVSSDHAYKTWNLMHSYDNKLDGDIRLMIKNILHSCSPINVINDVNTQFRNTEMENQKTIRYVYLLSRSRRILI